MNISKAFTDALVRVQMVCHLLGIATKFLSPIPKSKTAFPNVDNILFLYLLYNPTNLEMADSIARSQIISIYTDTCKSCLSYDFKTMFGHIVDYLIDLRKESNTPVPEDTTINHLKSCFSFALCDQYNYHSYI